MDQEELLKSFFRQNPNRNISHPEVVDWVIEEYKNQTGKAFRDPDRAIRKLAQSGFLIKVAKGIYKYDPDHITNPILEDFTAAQKQEIFQRDGFRCVMCGRGRVEGVEIHADHIKPKDLGGQTSIENGQTLCDEHNFKKKKHNQTDSGKEMFIHLYALAKAQNDLETQDFCRQILGVFEKNNVNGHIIWKK